jgi:hemolysin activation/secretion protein
MKAVFRLGLVALFTLSWCGPEASANTGDLRLRAIVLFAGYDDALKGVVPEFSGIDGSRTPYIPPAQLEARLHPLLDRPLTGDTPSKVVAAIREGLRAAGQPFVSVYVPPQDVTTGVMRVVVSRATLDGEIKIEGAKWFSEKSYREALPVTPGAPIDAAAVQAGIERLNGNPFRRVTLAAEPGATPGATKLTLRAQEQRPWIFTAGYNNTGTAVTDEDRITAGVTWGNAFGCGDLAGYTFTADPALEHSLTHSANYSTELGWGHSLVFFGAYSSVESILPEPLTQKGTSWQLGTRYGIPLRKSASGWERRVELSLDFKYADNNLEFALIPITNNVTHVAQGGVTMALSRRRTQDSVSLSASLYGSPGGITSENSDAAFDRSRAGASASYVYGRIEGSYGRTLPRDFSLALRGSVQTADGPLLGVEQLAGSGSVAVRGYRESAAFGDEGLLGSIELHAPPVALTKLKGRLDGFVFFDAGSLHNLGPQGDTTELAGAGPGLNLALGRSFSLSAAYGWQLKEIPYLADQGSGFGHLNATLRF